MNAERWKRIEEVYHSALASPPAGRAALLDELCSGDCDMGREVESLLEAREQAGSFLSPEHLHDHVTQLVSEPSLVGQTLGHYHIFSAVGAGAMGEVYLARDTRLDRQVALRILPPQFTRSRERVARFRREAKAASALNHPNIITIYDIGEMGDTWFIAAEFIEGVTLRQRLAAGRMGLQEVLGITLQCTRALEASCFPLLPPMPPFHENAIRRPSGDRDPKSLYPAKVAGVNISKGLISGRLRKTSASLGRGTSRGHYFDLTESELQVIH